MASLEPAWFSSASDVERVRARVDARDRTHHRPDSERLTVLAATVRQIRKRDDAEHAPAVVDDEMRRLSVTEQLGTERRYRHVCRHAWRVPSHDVVDGDAFE
jgi:hypothetical protein